MVSGHRLFGHELTVVFPQLETSQLWPLSGSDNSIAAVWAPLGAFQDPPVNSIAYWFTNK